MEIVATSGTAAEATERLLLSFGVIVVRIAENCKAAYAMITVWTTAFALIGTRRPGNGQVSRLEDQLR